MNGLGCWAYLEKRTFSQGPFASAVSLIQISHCRCPLVALFFIQVHTSEAIISGTTLIFCIHTACWNGLRSLQVVCSWDTMIWLRGLLWLRLRKKWNRCYKCQSMNLHMRFLLPPHFNVIFYTRDMWPVFHLQWLEWCFYASSNERSSSYLATHRILISPLWSTKVSFSFKGRKWGRGRGGCLLSLAFPE